MVVKDLGVLCIIDLPISCNVQFLQLADYFLVFNRGINFRDT